MSRWIRVQTSIFDHELFQSEPLTEREAWLWLIANAAWKSTRHRVGADMHIVPAGSLFVTLRQLQTAWKWKSDYRVRSFLKLLEKEEMIVSETNAGKTQVTICNYSYYQEAERTENARATQEKRTKDTSTPNTSSLRSDVEARARTTPKQDFVSELSDLLDAETIEAIIDHRRKKRAPITARAAKLLANELRKCADPRAAADMMILHGWQGLKAEWVENRTSSKRNDPPPKPRTIGDAIRDEARRHGVLRDEPDSENRGFHSEGYSGGNVRVLDLAFKPALKSFG
ncbi:hypothetical protein ACFOLL_04480 [Falsochrobactrum ovis]|uniref:Uncharacterized protein n=1 Tax=Falsochrobactrum ovis TaxID=1293442 RepID=A0A364JVJ0_9HYPH|nr:hypothetical protein [Falsochrobactrum ovis]RAK29130.1 hypothetical protein C7374_105181 [Falsochrobactrum ovis]